MTFSRSTHLLMYVSLETLMSIIRTGLPIQVELMDLVNSVMIFLSKATLLRWLTSLLGSQAVILTVLLFWISFFLLTPVFLLKCCLIFHWLSIIFTTGCLHYLWLFSCWLGRSSWTAPKSKVKFRQASNRCKKRFLKLPNLHMLIKQNTVDSLINGHAN